jgi:alginate O-acetyltransferase complex protein AlgI
VTFVSLKYVLFFVIVFAIYWRLSRRNQNIFILVASCLFYAAWDWRFLGLIAVSIFSNFICGARIADSTDPGRKKAWLWVAVVTNLGMLFCFKYANFFADSLVALADRFGASVDPVTMQIVLPVGISFYVFHSLSYSIDIYRGDLAKSDSLVDFAAFVTFFPQMVAGPIVRARELLFQLQAERRFTPQLFQSGIGLFLTGLFLKAFVADNLAVGIVDQVFAAPATFATPTLWWALIGYSLQIYADFCGYSLMASGSALLLGITLPVNFRYPYLAIDFSDFWRRWHISMSRFFRDYVYIGLGGNRGSRPRTLANLAFTNLVSGLWHGANWTFVAWGAQHAVLNSVNQLLREPLSKLSARTQRVLFVTTLVPRWLVVQLAIVLTWVVFRAPNFTSATQFYRGLFVWQDGSVVAVTAVVAFCIVAVAVDHLYGLVRERRGKWPVLEVYYPLAYVVMVLALFNGMPDNTTPFIYFQF